MPNILEKESNLRKNLYHICEFVIACVLIVQCRGIWNEIVPTRGWIGKVEIILLALAIITAIIISKTVLDLKRIAVCLIITAPLLIYFIIYLFLANSPDTHNGLRTLTAFAFLMIFYLLCVEKDKIPDLLFKYNWVITVVAGFTVVCWLLFSVLKVTEPTFQVLDWWNDFGKDMNVDCYYGVYYEPQYTYVLGMKVARNCGIFVEAPMAAFQFSIGLLIEFFLRKKTSIVRSIILIIALLSTIATTAYLVVLIAIVIKVIMIIVGSKKYKSAKKITQNWIKVVITAIIIGSLVLCVVLFKDEFVNSSGIYRWYDFKTGFVGWSNNWLFGSGYGSEYAWCNSLSRALADGGIMLGLVYALPFIFGILRAIRNKEYNVLIFDILVFLIVAITIVLYTYLVLFLFMFFGLYKSKVWGMLEEKIKV